MSSEGCFLYFCIFFNQLERICDLTAFFLNRYKKPLIVQFKNGASDWTDPTKWTKSSLLKMYRDWSILSGTSEDIVRSGGNGDTRTSFKEYLEIMHEKKHKEEPM